MANKHSIEDYVPPELTNEDKRYAAENLNETDETRENVFKNQTLDRERIAHTNW